MAPLSSLRPLGADLWVAEAPFRFFGLGIGARMTIVRLPGPSLLLHSPIAATADLVRAVAELGPVEFLVAPNRFHHLFVGDWQRAFPAARVHVAPGLETKRRDLAITGVLGDAADPAWAEALDQALLRGWPLVNEVVFFHRPSATLVASDLAFNLGPRDAASTRLAFRLLGGYGRLAPTLFERLLVRDRAAFAGSLARILAWPFERVIVAHGEVCERGGKQALARGYAWVLGDARGA